MRRRQIRATTAIAVMSAMAIAGPAAASAPTPRLGDSSQVMAARDDNASVCRAAEKTVQDGLKRFGTAMETVSTQASSGDLAAAEESVRKAGAELVSLSGRLRADAKNADDSALKTAVGDLASEFERLGKSLDDLTSLQNFDTTQLDKVGRRVGEFCAQSLSPGQSTPGAGSPSGFPVPPTAPSAPSTAPAPTAPAPGY